MIVVIAAFVFSYKDKRVTKTCRFVARTLEHAYSQMREYAAVQYDNGFNLEYSEVVKIYYI